MNASDVRTAGMIADRRPEHPGPAHLRQQTSCDSGRGRQLARHSRPRGRRGHAQAGRGANQPVLLIANEYYEIEKPLRDAAKGIAFRSVRSVTIASTMRTICKAEAIACDPDAIELIAERAGGDLRSAINDLQAAAQGQSEVRLEDVATAERDVKESIFKVLEAIFRGSNPSEALQASYTLDESPEDLVHWIDENLPVAYQGADLLNGFDTLARADVFLGG